MTIDEKAVFIKNNNLAISEFIEEFKPFIASCASGVTKRFLIYGEDDELSIALSAFYEAIVEYKPQRGPFLSFARGVIHRRLIDYLRKQKKFSMEILQAYDDPEDYRELEDSASVYTYTAEKEEQAMREEIAALEGKLAQFGINFSDLLQNSPKHKRLIESLKQAAAVFAKNEPLYTKFLQSSRLPIKELSENTNIPLKKIEKFRKYIIVVSVILHDHYDYLKEYVRVEYESSHIED
jgi:RNA polymerase sigma factor